MKLLNWKLDVDMQDWCGQVRLRPPCIQARRMKLITVGLSAETTLTRQRRRSGVRSKPRAYAAAPAAAWIQVAIGRAQNGQASGRQPHAAREPIDERNGAEVLKVSQEQGFLLHQSWVRRWWHQQGSHE